MSLPRVAAGLGIPFWRRLLVTLGGTSLHPRCLLGPRRIKRWRVAVDLYTELDSQSS